jgi:hypothetical protein
VQKPFCKPATHLLQGAKTFSQNSDTPLAGCKNLLAKQRHTSCRVQKPSRKTATYLLQGAKTFSQNVGTLPTGCNILQKKLRQPSCTMQDVLWIFSNGMLYNKHHPYLNATKIRFSKDYSLKNVH